MKTRQLFPILALMTALSSLGFVAPTSDRPVTSSGLSVQEGKAYWYSYYTKGRSVYMTSVYNTDCNHCDSRIVADFKKWLILNDYDNNARGDQMQNIHHPDKNKLEKLREERIIRFKQQGYSVTDIRYRYTGD